MRTFWAAWLAVQSALLVGARPDRALSRVVNTKYGRVQGFIQQHASHSLPPVEVFLGIPYASPPSGEGRFTPTSSPLPWEDVRKCLETPPVCPQPPLDPDPSLVPPLRAAHLAAIKPLLENQSEDCLYLNIYSPHDGKWRGVEGGPWVAGYQSRAKQSHTKNVFPRYYEFQENVTTARNDPTNSMICSAHSSWQRHVHDLQWLFCLR